METRKCGLMAVTWETVNCWLIKATVEPIKCELIIVYYGNNKMLTYGYIRGK
jgi:hypothetical protein